MLRGFRNILVKEIKELMRDPKIFLGMIIVPLIIFPVLGGIMTYSRQSAIEKAEKTVALIVNHDIGENASQFISYLDSSLVIVEVDVTNINDAVRLMPEYNATEIIEIPESFSQNLTGNLVVHLKVFSVFSGTGVFEGIGSSIIDSLMAQFNRRVAPDVIYLEKSAIIKDEIVEGVDANMLSALLISQSIAMPITIMILLTYSMQIAATSVAMEKEEKTLETLLTLPVDRFSILMGKLSGSIIVAGVGALAYMFGFNFYMGSFMTADLIGTSLDLASLGLVPSPLGYLLLGISLFVTLLSALALAIIISAFSEDVRGAQSLVGFIYPIVFIPSLLLMYLDINSLPSAIRILIYSIPYAHPIIAAKTVAMGDHLTALGGIVYVSAFTLVIMYVASRLFATEKILTAKLKFRGLRKRRSVRN